jgi:hypothetical protein
MMLEHERINLDMARKGLEQQRLIELDKMRMQHENYTEDMIRAKDRNYSEKIREIDERQYYNDLMKQNEFKQLMKEQNYRNVNLKSKI